MRMVEHNIPVSVTVVEDEPLISKKSIIDELRALQIEKQRANAPVEEGPSDFTLKSLQRPPVPKGKKKKKAEKKKKADKSISSKISDLPIIANNQVAGDTDEDRLAEQLLRLGNGRSLNDIIDDMENQDDEEMRGLREIIIDEQRNKHESRRKDGSRFTKKFADQLTVLYDMLGESNEFSKLLSRQVKTMMTSKARGASKGASDMAEVALTSANNRLAIIKEINSVNKIIADLELKEETMNAKASSASTENKDYAGTHFMQTVLSMGRNNVLQNMGGGSGNSGTVTSEDDTDMQLEAIQALRSGQTEYSDDELDDIDDLINSRLEEEDNPFRSSDGRLNIKYENLDVKINIKRCIDTQEWEFVAIDKYNQQVPDYPLPDPQFIGKVAFSQDGKIATDERGRSYKVIEYYSTEDEYED